MPDVPINEGARGSTEQRPFVIPSRYLTDGIEGIGGMLKSRPEDFLVEEIPLYEPSGEGEHLYLLIEKRGLSTFDLLNIVARHFDVQKKSIGYAGLKDKHAITRQMISVHLPGVDESAFRSLDGNRITVLGAFRHVNKLRRGHLKGNRFSIKVRNVEITGALRARQVLEKLSETGMPNRLGEQRFGVVGNNHLLGRAIIADDAQEALDVLLGPSSFVKDDHAEGRDLYTRGKYNEARAKFPSSLRPERTALRFLASGATPERAVQSIERNVRKYFVSGIQSAAFNATLDQRLVDGTWDKLIEGDLAFKHDNRAVFSVDKSVLEDPTMKERLDRFDISPSGPMWGPDMTRCQGEVDQIELDALARYGLTPEQIVAFAKSNKGMIEGSRRPLRVQIVDPEVEGGLDEHGPFVRCAFDLPRGSFATVVMREIMKTDRFHLNRDE